MLATTAELAWTRDPLDALRRWPAGRPVVLLHSGRFDPSWARWSVLAEPVEAVRCELDDKDRPRCRRLNAAGQVHDAGDDAWAAIDAASVDEAPWLGYFGYDLGRCVERLPQGAVDDRGWPAMQLQRCPGWAVYDHAVGRWRAGGTWATAGVELAEQAHGDGPAFEVGPLTSAVTPQRFRADVQRVLDYIAAGDVFQVNLAHRLTGAFHGSPRAFHAALSAASPAWYGAYVDMLRYDDDEPRRTLCSASPELFLDAEAGHGREQETRVVTRPIKGTRPAAAGEGELAGSHKDAAELAMIVDLLRNDLGRVGRFGSVRVEAPRDIEHHPTVQHATATISAVLRQDATLGELLRATLPGGSITGAPKVRAMEIIDELEPVRRGPYCGCIGVMHRGSCRLNIAIRTAAITRPATGEAPGTLDAAFGAGIVADSDPQAEYDETMVKARAMRAATSRTASGAAL